MCKNDNFSCLKTKPYRSKRCKVLTNQYADKKREGDCPLFFGTPEGTQLNPSCGRNKSHLRGMKSLRDEIRLCREKDGFNFIQAVGWDFICVSRFHPCESKDFILYTHTSKDAYFDIRIFSDSSTDYRLRFDGLSPFRRTIGVIDGLSLCFNTH